VPAWDWRSTTSDSKIYIEIFKWPTGSFHLDKLPRQVSGSYLLADPAKKQLKMTKNGDAIDIVLPAKVLDSIATVLVLTTN
jgi:alpha-L-fucosidase